MIQRTWCVLPGLLLLCAGCSTWEEKGARFLASGKQQLQKRDFSGAALQFKNAARYLPREAEPHYQEGLAHLGAGDFQRAAQSFARATKVDPKHLKAQTRLAELMSGAADPELAKEAKKRAEAVLAADPKDVDGLAALARAEIRLGQRREAEGHLAEALRISPGHLKCSAMLAELRIAEKNLAGAEEILRKAAEVNPDSPDALITMGRFCRITGDLNGAETQFRRALERDPANGPALLALADVQLRTKRKDAAEQSYRRAAALPEGRYKTAHALFLFEEGQHEAALKEWEELLRRDPDDRVSRRELIGANWALKRPKAVEGLLDAAIERDPKDAETRLQRGVLYLSTKRFGDAQNEIEKAVRFRPEWAQAHYVLSQVYKAQAARGRQQDEIRRTLQLDPQFLAARLELAESLLASGRHTEALEVLDQAPEAQRRTLPVIIERNWALLELDRAAELERGIASGAAIRRTPSLILQEAALKMKRGQEGAGRELMNEVLRRNPEDVDALDMLARSYAARHQPEMALETVRAYVSLRPNSAAMQHLLGMWLLAGGKHEEARKAFAAAKAADPESTAHDLALARLDVAEARYDGARQRLSGLLATMPDHVEGRMLLAVLEHQAGRWNEAAAEYRRVIGSEPRNVIALNNLAYLLAVRGGQLDEALQLAQHASKLAPEDAGVQDTLGWVLYLKGLYHTAIPHLETAVQRGGTAARTYHLAMAYLKAGDRVRGRQTLEAALRKDRNAPEAKMAQEVMAQIEMKQ